MTAPLVVDGAPIGRVNPVATLSAALVVTLALFLSVDLVTPTVIVAVELALLPLTGLRPRVLLRRCWPLLLAAVGIGIVNILFAGDPTGEVLLDAGPILVTSGSLVDGVALGVRLLGLALPGVLFFAGTDPTRLADALITHWRVPARFAIGVLAALRLVPLMAAEWHQIRLARRTRGIDSAGSPVKALRLFFAGLLTLLIGAIRRGTRLASAMDSRGFDSGTPRTSARESVLVRRDWLVVLAGLVIAVAAVAISVATGAWRFILT